MEETSESKSQSTRGESEGGLGSVRPGVEADIEAIDAFLSADVDPDGHSILLSACGGLEERLLDDSVLIFERHDRTIIGCLQSGRLRAGNLQIEALAVADEYRDAVVCEALLDALLSTYRDKNPCVHIMVAPQDHAMLSLLFDRDFVVRSMIRDHIEPGIDGFCCQRSNRVQDFDPSERIILPSTALAEMQTILVSDERVITGLVNANSGSVFEVDRLERDDPASLRSDEGMSSVAFSAGILAAITFFLGFAFSSNMYPDEVRIMLIGATASTTAALVIYANAAGELSRIRNMEFAKYMRWGNLLSEYGGVIPLLIILPVTYAQVVKSVSSLVTAVLVSAALSLYTWSGFCVASRYTRTLCLSALDVLICLGPILGVVAVLYLPLTWPWAALTGLALILRFSLMLVRDDRERGKSDR